MRIIKYVPFIVLVLYFGCEKPNEQNTDTISNPLVINFVDSIIQPTYYQDDESKIDSFNIKINQDKFDDITFMAYSYEFGNYSKEFSGIRVLNNFEIAVQNTYKYSYNDWNEDHIYGLTDSTIVNIPKILNKFDTISTNLTYKTGYFDFTSDNSSSWQGYSDKSIMTGWNDIGEKYIGIRNTKDNIYCWIKLEIINYNTIHISSYYYSTNTEYLIIDE